ncbi:MAG: hypothetical protein UX91_C0004G0048 [Candidatus Amesbacteria bacterium GW2011_GWB1_47_19]|nr:MAG: hypothetical protein UW51_C0005G0048 [Candidatus Amesbacteria bacterium GW2011_GWA1_44_24]KKU31605.1 MAG: hypothetical protein UX46_C0004G0048 [Candidatus Amesbacteria bacterium GW2011_GWC1_46_24]KKU67378.1 MAG: hypothetical protein UX91_C0004G0048 [Candidatus Amesbacteria bacterium GW2011_GWB1_47_19]OGD05406.1 MAG: hypothetical protein A2379_05505 [Candidatus Amesbacteria bacterium RIFOXYB1_FULL_47_13]HBC72572.1 hypothetical protein [Candidatus Amesbacteria bacterium]
MAPLAEVTVRKWSGFDYYPPSKIRLIWQDKSQDPKITAERCDNNHKIDMGFNAYKISDGGLYPIAIVMCASCYNRQLTIDKLHYLVKKGFLMIIHHEKGYPLPF